MRKFLLIITLGFLLDEGLASDRRNVCSYRSEFATYSSSHYTAGCGLWSWARCDRYRQNKHIAYRTAYRCCEGWAQPGQSGELQSWNTCDLALCHGESAGTCANGGTCVSSNICSCPLGFEPPKCDDMNECLVDNGGCEHRCENTYGSYRCHCHTGYSMKDNKTCQAVCNDGIAGGCPNGGTCISPNVCVCPPGFQAPDCTDEDECSSDNGGCEQNCQNTHGSYRCSCNEGFYLQDDLRACNNVSLSVCLNGDDKQSCPMCEFALGERCKCPPALFISSDGRRCLPACKYDLCGNGGKCTELFLDEEDDFWFPEFSQLNANTTGTELFLRNHENSSDVEFSHDSVTNSTLNQTFAPNNQSPKSTHSRVPIGFECDCSGTGFVGKFCVQTLTTITTTMTVAESTSVGLESTGSTKSVESTTAMVLRADQLNETTNGTKTENSATEPKPPEADEHDEPADEEILFDDSDLEDFDWTGSGRETEIKRIVENCTFDVSYTYLVIGSVSISVPKSVTIQAGKGFQSVDVTVSSNQLGVVRICADRSLQVRPSVIEAVPPSKTTTVEISAEDRGLYLIALMGSSRSEPIAVIDTNVEDVFRRLQLSDSVLPQGSHNLDFEFKGTQLRFTSTSHWCSSPTQAKVYFTKGLVFSAAGEDSLPLSATGLEISIGKNLLTGPVSSHRRFEDCIVAGNLLSRRKRDWVEQVQNLLTDDDQKDLVKKQAVLSTLFKTLNPKFPDWLKFGASDKKTEETGETTVQIVNGFKAQRLDPCFGAPLFEKTVYHVYRFRQSFNITFLTDNMVLPGLESGQEYCLAVDLNKDKAGTFVLKSPKAFGGADSLTFNDILPGKRNIRLKYSAIGISIPRELNGHRRPLSELGSISDETYYDATELISNPSESVSLWNGDTTFSYPTKERVNVWYILDSTARFGDDDSYSFEIKTTFDALFNVPDMEQTFRSLQLEPWDVNFRSISGFQLKINFKIAKKKFSIDLNNLGPSLFAIDMFGYGSIGGPERVYCGSSANPPGIFIEANVNGKLLRGIPYLEGKVAELTFSSADLKVQFFKTFNKGFKLHADYRGIKEVLVKASKYMKSMKPFVKKIQGTLTVKEKGVIGEDLQAVYDALENALSNTEHIYKELAEHTISARIDKVLQDIANILTGSEKSAYRVEVAYNFKLRVLGVKLVRQAQQLKLTVMKLYKIAYSLHTGLMTSPGSWGIRGRFSIHILGDLYALQGYFIQADEGVTYCGTAGKYFEHMKGQSSYRIFGKVEFPIQILPKVKIDVGFGVEIAFSQDSHNFVVRLHAQAKFLGYKITIDVFVNNKGLHSIYEANIYDIFRARVTLGASVFVPRDEWYALLRVELMPGGDGFEGSLIDVLKNYVKKLAKDAYNRIQGAQNSIESAKKSVTKAQEEMRKAKVYLDAAKGELDKGIAALERAKDKVEAAKAPFKKAIEALNKAKKRVDNLCTIHTCNDICIPGIKVRLCWSGWFPYPCISTTNCMIRIPNPICVLKNAACYVLRGLAYAALEIAKAAVHLPMLVMDGAKLVLSAAQVAVNIAKAALDVAKGAVDVAIAVVDAAKVVMDIAKAALKAVKLLVRLAFQVFEFIVDYGLKSLFDIKTCGFEFVVSAKEGAEFEVFCNINPFRLGWRNVGFRINFRNIFSSLWNAAKSLAAQFIGLIKNAFGRRKREISDAILPRLSHILRYRREANAGDNTASGDSLFGDFFRNGTLVSNVSWEHDTQFWDERCSEYIPVYRFLKTAMDTLYNASLTVSAQVDDILAVNKKVNELNSYDESEAAFQEEINFDVALSDFNFTREQLLDALKEANLQDNVVTQASKNATNFLKEQNENTTDEMSRYDILTLWKLEIHNISKRTFTEDECADYSDCVAWSLIQLSTVFSSVEARLIPNAEETLSELEFVYYDLLANTTKSIQDVKNNSVLALELLAQLDFSDIFCGEAPVVTQYPSNRTVLLGSNVSMSCQATGIPPPDYFWYKEDELFMYGADTIIFVNVSLSDEGNYTCVAGNHILNVSTPEVILTVVYPPTILSPMESYAEFVTGDEIKLACKADGKPRALTSWNTTSEVLYNSQELENVLILNSTNTSSSGIYSCLGINDYGWDTSREILVDIKTSYPACPSTIVEIGFLSTFEKPKHSPSVFKNKIPAEFEDQFYSTVFRFVEREDVVITLDILDVDDEINIVTLELGIDCSNTTQCIKQTCVESYNNLTNIIRESVRSLEGAIREERFLFASNGERYYFNRAQFDVGQVMPQCPENYTRREEIVCVYSGQLYEIPGPTNMNVMANSVNVTITWQSPTALHSFIRGYTLVVMLPGEELPFRMYNFSSLYTSWVLNKYKDFTQIGGLYDVKIRAVTASHQSQWTGQKVDMTAKAGMDVVFAVLMGLLFSSLTVLSVLVAVYHLKAPQTKVTELSAPPPYSPRPVTTIAELATKVPVPRSAWQ